MLITELFTLSLNRKKRWAPGQGEKREAFRRLHPEGFPRGMRFQFKSGFAGPKCFSMTSGSDGDSFTIFTPSRAACSETKYSS